MYALVDPRDGAWFYVGKGCRKRAWAHLKGDTSNWHKRQRIAAIRAAGLEPTVEIVTSGMGEAEALQRERELIRLHKATLANIMLGRMRAARHGVVAVRAILGRLAALKSEDEIRAEGVIYCGGTALTAERRLRVRRECVRDYLLAARTGLSNAGTGCG